MFLDKTCSSGLDVILPQGCHWELTGPRSSMSFSQGKHLETLCPKMPIHDCNIFSILFSWTPKKSNFKMVSSINNQQEMRNRTEQRRLIKNWPCIDKELKIQDKEKNLRTNCNYLFAQVDAQLVQYQWYHLQPSSLWGEGCTIKLIICPSTQLFCFFQKQHQYATLESTYTLSSCFVLLTFLTKFSAVSIRQISFTFIIP